MNGDLIFSDVAQLHNRRISGAESETWYTSANFALVWHVSRSPPLNRLISSLLRRSVHRIGIWCVFRVKALFSNLSHVVWTRLWSNTITTFCGQPIFFIKCCNLQQSSPNFCSIVSEKFKTFYLRCSIFGHFLSHFEYVSGKNFGPQVAEDIPTDTATRA